jgi:hypothetical protein
MITLGVAAAVIVWSGSGNDASPVREQPEGFRERRLHDLNTSIADENVDRAETLKGCSNAGLDSGLVADIHTDSHGAAAGAIDLIRGRLRRPIWLSILPFDRGRDDFCVSAMARILERSPTSHRSAGIAGGRTLFGDEQAVNPAQNRTVDKVKNKRRHRRLRPERQRE